MSVTEGRMPFMTARWRGVRLVIAAAAVVFAGLALAGTLPVAYALTGFAIVAATAALALRSSAQDDRLSRPMAISERGDDFLKALVAGLPDPVVALDRDSRVLALNERARAIAPPPGRSPRSVPACAARMKPVRPAAAPAQWRARAR